MTLAELITATSQVGLNIALGSDRKSLSIDKPKGTLSKRQQELLDEVTRRKDELVRYLQGDPPEPKEFAIPTITSAQFDNESYDINYIVEGTVAENQPLIVAGGYKEMKTSVAIDLTVALGSGGFFLGKFRVARPYRVGVLSAESGMAVLQETARRICNAANVQLRDLDVFWAPTIPKFQNPLHLHELTRWLDTNGIEVVILDPAYMAMPGENSGNLMSQGELLRAMGDACSDGGAMPIILHHNKRRGAADMFRPAELSDISWSGFAEWARQWLLLSRRERYEPGSGEHRLWLNVGGSAGHSGLYALDIEEGTSNSFEGRRWEVEVSYADEARQDARQREAEAKERLKREKEEAQLQEDLMTLYAALGKGANTKNGIRTRGNMRDDRAGAAIAEALRLGTIRECLVKKNTTTYDGFELVPEEEKQCA